LLFLDLSKAFNCVETETLLVRLSKYGFRGKFLNWIESFLINRKQYAEIKNEQKCVQSEKKYSFKWCSARFSVRSITVQYLCK